jgi:hypothetical protein
VARGQAQDVHDLLRYLPTDHEVSD